MCYAKDRRELIILRERDPFDHGFGEQWRHAHVFSRQGYHTSVADFHKHDFYEINLIVSGNVNVLLGDRREQAQGCRVVLTPPGAPHYITCAPDMLYNRLYLVFSREYIVDYLPEWVQFSRLFGTSGAILSPTDAEATELYRRMEEIGAETVTFRKRLLIYALLSRMAEIANTAKDGQRIPSYIAGALAYLDEHCGEHITAAEVAAHLHVGRTALMTAFKRYTGSTVVEYLTLCRLRRAVGMLSGGGTLEEVAAACGFADQSGLSRAFKRCYGETPRRYMEKR